MEQLAQQPASNNMASMKPAPAITLIKPRNPSELPGFTSLQRSGSLNAGSPALALLAGASGQQEGSRGLEAGAYGLDAAAMLGAGSDMLAGLAGADTGVPSASKVSTPSEQQEEETEEESGSSPQQRRGGRGSALAKRKAAAVRERASQMMMPSLAQEVAGLLGQDMPMQRPPMKRPRGPLDSDTATDAMPSAARSRRQRTHDDFNAASLIGSIFLRVQGTRAPAPLVHFEDDIRVPHWFKESIDGVQPVMSIEEFDLEQVTLESMGKLVDGNVLPATLGEVAAYFSHVLGDPRTNKEISPRVLIAIQCDRAKGWFTYKRDHDNSNFVPVVLCASENGRGLEEVSPAHFEVHRAQCAQKKWRQSFKVLGAQKLHKVTSLAQAALGDVLRHLERILGGADKPLVLKQIDASGQVVPITVLPPRITPAAVHPTFRNNGGPMADMVELGLSPLGSLPMASSGRPGSGALDGTILNRLPTTNSAGGTRSDGITLQPNVARLPSNTSPHRPMTGMLPGARPMQVGGARGGGGAKGLAAARRHTEDPTARPHDMARGLDLLATAASNAITSPRAGGGPHANVQAGLVAAALSGVSFNELMQLLVDNNNRKQHYAAQAQLLQQLAALQQQALAGERVDLAAAVAATAANLGVKPPTKVPRGAAATAAAAAATIAKSAAAANKEAAAANKEAAAASKDDEKDKDKEASDGAAEAPLAAADGEAAAAPAVEPAAEANGAAEPAAEGAAADSSAVATVALSLAEREAIHNIMKNVKGADVAHAVRGILQHVAMQYAGEYPLSDGTVPALASALADAAVEEGIIAAPEPVEGEAAGEEGEGAGGERGLGRQGSEQAAGSQAKTKAEPQQGEPLADGEIDIAKLVASMEAQAQAAQAAGQADLERQLQQAALQQQQQDAARAAAAAQEREREQQAAALAQQQALERQQHQHQHQQALAQQQALLQQQQQAALQQLQAAALAQQQQQHHHQQAMMQQLPPPQPMMPHMPGVPHQQPQQPPNMAMEVDQVLGLPQGFAAVLEEVMKPGGMPLQPAS